MYLYILHFCWKKRLLVLSKGLLNLFLITWCWTFCVINIIIKYKQSWVTKSSWAGNFGAFFPLPFIYKQYHNKKPTLISTKSRLYLTIIYIHTVHYKLLEVVLGLNYSTLPFTSILLPQVWPPRFLHVWLIKFPEKHDKNHEIDNEMHPNTLNIFPYVPKYF